MKVSGWVDESEGQPRVIDEDARLAAKPMPRLGEYALALRRLGPIRHQRQQPIRRGTSLDLHFADIFADVPRRSDARALLQKPRSHRTAQSAETANDDRDLIVHLVPPRSTPPV
jgi:hypothetical protein